MSALPLILLSALAGTLCLLAALSACLKPAQRYYLMQATAVLSGLGLLAALAAIILGTDKTILPIPLGLPGTGMKLALDGLSAFFALPVCLSGLAAATWSWRSAEPTAPAFPLFLGAMLGTLLAADGFTLIFCFELMSISSWSLVLTRQSEATTREAGLLYIGMAAFSAACLVPALALLAPPGAFPDLSFAALRAAPHEGWNATLILFLALAGAGSKAGLVPLHNWLPLAHPAAPSHVSAVMSGAMTKVALYVLIRILFDLAGPAQPLWWGVPLLVLGAASAALGALRAVIEADIKSILASSTVENIGIATIGLGVALAARGADLPGLAALALGGTLLHVLGHAAFKTLAFLAAGAAQHGAATRRLDRLGGLIHRMPVTTIAMLAGGAGLAALPLGPGFAGEWVIFQALFAAPRIGNLAMQTLLVVVVAVLALSAALAAAAAVRLIGVAFLGRPRTPRAAAADEAARPARATMLALAGLCLVLGLLPGPVLQLAAPAIHLLTGTAPDFAGVLLVAPQSEAPGYSALGIALLVCVLAGALYLFGRRFFTQGERRASAWDCGFGAPPPWLPFGDPATQYGGTSMAQPLARALGRTMLGVREEVEPTAPGETGPARYTLHWRDPAEALILAPLAILRDRLAALSDLMQTLSIRRTLGVMFSVLVFLLALIAWLEAT